MTPSLVKSLTQLKCILKAAIFTFILALSTVPLSAQFRSGIVGGGTMTQVIGDNINGFNKVGLLGGMFVKIDLNDHWSFRTEVLYVGKGSRKPANVSAQIFDKRGYTFHYLELPLLTEYHFERFFLQGGLYGGILLWGKEMFAGEHFEVINPSLSTFDVGFVGGIGFEFNDKIDLFTRFTASILPIRSAPDDANITRFWDNGFRNIAVHVGVSYSFE